MEVNSNGVRKTSFDAIETGTANMGYYPATGTIQVRERTDSESSHELLGDEHSRRSRRHGRHSRTQTIMLDQNILEVKKAFQEQEGEVPTDDLLVDEAQAVRICCLPVKEGVRWWNVMAIPLVPCIIMTLTTYVNAQSILMLRDDQMFQINEDNLGSISSTLVLAGFPGAMLGTFFAGYLFDILGRKITLISTFIAGSVFVFVIPYTAPSVFPALLIVRMLITTTLSAPNSNPLLADYIHKDAIGKAAALIGLGYVVGEVIAMAVLFKVTKPMNEYNAFMTVAIFGAICSVMFLFLVKEPQLRQKADEIITSPENKANLELFDDEKNNQRQPLITPVNDASAAQSASPATPLSSSGARSQTASTTSSQALSEEDFNKLTFCQKLRHINRQLIAACKQNKMFPVLFFASFVTRLYYVMFSTFWILYLTSYVGTVLKDDEEVSTVYANLMLVSVAFAISLSPLIGVFTDRVSPRITLPVSFLLRAFAIALFYFISDPTSFYAYAVGSLLVLGTTAEQICSDSILMRNAEREIRGVIYGTGVAMGYLGQLILCILGGWLFDHVSPQAPFLFVGALDLVFAVVVIILGANGTIKNDIRERKEQAEKIREKKAKIQAEIDRRNQESEEAQTSPPAVTANPLNF